MNEGKVLAFNRHVDADTREGLSLWAKCASQSAVTIVASVNLGLM